MLPYFIERPKTKLAASVSKSSCGIYLLIGALCAQSCPVLCNPMDHNPPDSSVHRIFPGKNTRVGCCFLLQGIFLTQGSNLHLLCLLHWQADSLPLVPHRNPQDFIQEQKENTQVYSQWQFASNVWHLTQFTVFVIS